MSPEPAPRSERERLRSTFGVDAERYNRMRPGYPAQLFADLAQLACIGPACRVLEIGPGTGQATIALAERGCEIIAVELSQELAAVARRRLAPFPRARIAAADFEAWPLPAEPFDTVVSATAFHWIDAAVRVTKAADALAAGGALAIIGTHHVAGGSDQFFVDVQSATSAGDPATPAGLRLPRAADVTSSSEELDRSGRFGRVTSRRYEWNAAYSAAEYRDLLLTYSGHLTLEPAAREGLLACIADLIDSRYGGRIVKRYLTEMRVAVRK
jgi:SAM-dependent methyltransferase